MTVPKEDLRFPERPQHPDFWKLSETVIANDSQADGGKSVREVVSAAGFDYDSLYYMAARRALMLMARTKTPETEAELMAAMTSLWTDAFLAGLKIGDERSVTQALDDKLDDGNRRQRS